MAATKAIEWLTPTEAAAVLGKSVQSIAQWRYHGQGPRYYKALGRIRYKRSDLDDFLENGVVDPRSQPSGQRTKQATR